MRGGRSAAVAHGCFALARLDGASLERYRSLHTQDPVLGKVGTGGGAHPGHPRGAAAEEKACRGCEGAGTLHRPLGALIRGMRGRIRGSMRTGRGRKGSMAWRRWKPTTTQGGD